jgi:glycosyltransferase involved in cell wall biosynthesis
MNIGVDATALYGRYSGVEYSLWNLLGGLNVVDGENNFIIYIPHDGPPEDQLAGFGARWRWVRLPFDGGDKARRVWWQQTQLPLALARDGCNLLHAPTYVAPAWSPVPVVLTVYDLIALTHPEFATRLNRMHYRVLLPRSLERARRVLVPSQSVQEEIARCVPSASARTRVVPLALEPAFFATYSEAQKADVRQRYGLPQRFVLFVGNFEPKKNLRRVLEAFRAVPEAPPLVLAGGGRAWNTYELEHDLQQPGPTNGAVNASSLRVLSIGYVRRRDLPLLYALCEAFIFPSLAEGFGLPVLEALACGATVIASTRVPLPRLDEVALICDPSDVQSISHQLRRAATEPELRTELGHKGRHYAQPFTWRRAAAQTLDVYREAASF